MDTVWDPRHEQTNGKSSIRCILPGTGRWRSAMGQTLQQTAQQAISADCHLSILYHTAAPSAPEAPLLLRLTGLKGWRAAASQGPKAQRSYFSSVQTHNHLVGQLPGRSTQQMFIFFSVYQNQILRGKMTETKGWMVDIRAVSAAAREEHPFKA